MGGGRKDTPSRRVALGGVLSALALILLVSGGFIPVGTFAAPIFASICLVPIAIELGAKWALLCYLAVSILGVLLVPDLELVLFFVVLLGYYPVLRTQINKLHAKALRWILKVLLFNTAVAAVYAILLFLLVSPALVAEFSEYGPWLIVGALAGANLVFVLYDILLDYVRVIYFSRIRRQLFK